MNIRNCEFKFKCQQSWDGLTHTDNSNVRFCNVCDKHVYFCQNNKALLNALIQNHCVAINLDEQSLTNEHTQVGQLEVPNYQLKNQTENDL